MSSMFGGNEEGRKEEGKKEEESARKAPKPAPAPANANAPAPAPAPSPVPVTQADPTTNAPTPPSIEDAMASVPPTPTPPSIEDAMASARSAAAAAAAASELAALTASQNAAAERAQQENDAAEKSLAAQIQLDKPSPLALFQSTLKTFAAFAASNKSKIATSNASLAEGVAAITANQTTQTTLKHSIAVFLSQQITAAEEEDFETAHSLSEKILTLQNELEERKGEFEKETDQAANADGVKLELRVEILAALNSVTSNFTAIQSEMGDYLQKNATELAPELADKSKKLEAELQRLQIDEKHIVRDEANVAEERQELESTIGEQVSAPPPFVNPNPWDANTLADHRGRGAEEGRRGEAQCR